MIRVEKLGITDYPDALARMRAYVSRRADARRKADDESWNDELWLTEHPPVYTLGFASRPEHLRATGAIPIVTTERGGQVTYHGPGQVIAYLLLDLRRRKLGVRDLVCRSKTGSCTASRCTAWKAFASRARPASTSARKSAPTDAPTGQDRVDRPQGVARADLARRRPQRLHGPGTVRTNRPLWVSGPAHDGRLQRSEHSR